MGKNTTRDELWYGYELPSEKDTIQKTKKGKTDENAKKINDDYDDARVVSFYWKCVQAWGHKLLQWLNRLALVSGRLNLVMPLCGHQKFKFIFFQSKSGCDLKAQSVTHLLITVPLPTNGYRWKSH